MCTVTYIPAAGATYITSNRDENKHREKATSPITELWNGQPVTFPKDPAAGGSWFAISEKGTVVVLLNGAEKKHEPVYPYRKSRGLILLELASDPDGITAFEKIDLENIEPFTIIFFDQTNLFQIQWDGLQKTKNFLDTTSSYIWSSVTLYSEDVIQKRSTLFNRFISSNTEITSEEIIRFHQNSHGDYENGFIIHRENGIITQSVSQAIIENNSLQFIHYDLLNDQRSETSILPAQASAV